MVEELDRVLVEVEGQGGAAGLELQGQMWRALGETEDEPHKTPLETFVGQGGGALTGAIDREEGASGITLGGEHVGGPYRGTVAQHGGHEGVEQEVQAVGILNSTGSTLADHAMILGQGGGMQGSGGACEALTVVEEEAKVPELRDPFQGLVSQGQGG